MIVGITGGIGSGKTFVAKEFCKLSSCAYYHADEEAKKLMNSSEEIRKEIIQEFGEESYQDNQLNRKYLADKVFNNKRYLERLNSIVHPKVKQHIVNFIKENNNKDFIVYENAILFEINSDVFCDYVIHVSVNLKERIARVMKRDHVTENQVLERVNNQWSDSKRKLLCNYNIENHDRNETVVQVKKIFNNLTEKS